MEPKHELSDKLILSFTNREKMRGWPLGGMLKMKGNWGASTILKIIYLASLKSLIFKGLTSGIGN